MPGEDRNIWLDAAIGAAGGAAGMLILNKLSRLLYAKESRNLREHERRVRPELPFEVLARKVSRDALGLNLSRSQLKQLANGLHWGWGVGLGAAYGVAAPRFKPLRAAGGLGFGLAVWLLGDELLTWALGLSGPPQAFPWQNHLRGLAAHLSYGASVAGTRTASEALLCRTA